MKSIWLGQGGLLIISGKLKIMIDPYLSNGMHDFDRTMRRRLKIDKRFLKIKPDLLILTNSHADHADMKTVKKLLYKTRQKTVVLASGRAYDRVYSERIPGRYTNIMFEEGDEWTVGHILVTGIKCRTDDKTAFGLLIEDSMSNKKIYYVGNTLYNKAVIETVPKGLDVAYIPITGRYSTMNITDAQRFVSEIDAKVVVPIHYGMFDNVDPRKFECKNKMIAKPYVVIPIDAETAETKKLSGPERLKLGLDEKPSPFPKTLKQAIKAEKAENKAYSMRKQLVDALEKMVEYDDPTLTDQSGIAVADIYAELGSTPQTEEVVEEKIDKKAMKKKEKKKANKSINEELTLNEAVSEPPVLDGPVLDDPAVEEFAAEEIPPEEVAPDASQEDSQTPPEQ
ncbi:MAG: MBL fold metallo-hydrolase [Ruminococcaceae bacterium]|nr:MBL fold metallo-hydrolase [Oscillospiraceae bacterium]